MADSDAPRMTLMESKILRLGMKQHEKGFGGGAITPGFIRKETEYSYRAINMALESLIGHEFMEKLPRSTFRNGELVKLDVYKITYKGIEAFERLEAGKIEVSGQEPEPQPRFESQSQSKPWDRHRDEGPRRDWQRPAGYQEAQSREFADAVKAMHVTMKLLQEEIKALHAKVDSLAAHHRTQAQPQAQTTAQPAEAVKLKSGDHAALVLGSVKSLAPVRDYVIADEVRETYFAECQRLGIKPKGMSQFTPYLKRLESKGLLELKRMGCRNLGIKGHGSRVVVSLSAQGAEYLARYGSQ